MKIIRIKAILSSFLLVTFIVVTFTGVGLYFSTQGKLVDGTLFSLLGFNVFKLKKMHTFIGFIMSGLITVHLFINYKIFLVEIKSLFKE